MAGYVARRLALAVPVLLGTSIIVFALVYALPGDPLRALYGDRPLSPTAEVALRERYHLDDGLAAQYGHYLGRLVRGDLGEDFSGQAVSTLIADGLAVSLRLLVTALVIQVVLGVGLGVAGALRRGRAVDHAILGGTVLLLSVPLFVLALAAQAVFGVALGWLPIAGPARGWPIAYVLPALVVALVGLAPIARLTRTSLVESLRSEHVRTARAKGLSPARVVVRHALRTSLVPVATYVAADLGIILGGTVVVESVFNLPGIGQLLVTSIDAQEGAVVVGVSTMLVLVFVLSTLAVDLLYGVLDPRVRRG